MAAAPIIVETLERGAPNLTLAPEWAPAPSPPLQWGPVGVRGDWSEVWDWIKEHAILPAGRPVDNPWATPAEVQQMIDASVGSAVKALSGFVNLNASMTLEAASLLEQAIGNVANNQLHDFRVQSERIDEVVNVQRYLIDYAFPEVFRQIHATGDMSAALAQNAERNAIRYAQDQIFRPLVETIGQVKIDVQARADVQHMQAVDHANRLNASTIGQVMTTIAPLAAALRATASFIDECARPMCETMGPATQLGKLLKGLNTAATLALLASLAAMSKDDVGNLLESISRMAGGILGDLEHFLVGGSGTLGGTLAGAGT